MDAILSLGVTKLVDLLTAEKINLTTLSVDQRRDLLLLAALYDASTKRPIAKRWSRLRRQSGFRPLWSRRDLQIGFGTTLVVIALIAAFPWLDHPQDPSLAARSDPGGMALLGLAADPGGMVRPRYSQGSARAQPRSVGAAVGATVVQAARSWEASRFPRLLSAAPKSDTSSCASFRRFCILLAMRESSS